MSKRSSSFYSHHTSSIQFNSVNKPVVTHSVPENYVSKTLFTCIQLFSHEIPIKTSPPRVKRHGTRKKTRALSTSNVERKHSLFQTFPQLFKPSDGSLFSLMEFTIIFTTFIFNPPIQIDFFICISEWEKKNVATVLPFNDDE